MNATLTTNPKLLIADDSVIERSLICRILRDHWPEATILQAQDGEEALRLVELEMPDVVLTDMNMPNVTGLELVSALKERHPTVPTILLTKFGRAETATQGLLKGASSYVPKSALTRWLVPTVEQMLEISHKTSLQDRVSGCVQQYAVRIEIDNNPELVGPVVSRLLSQLDSMKLFCENDRNRIGIALYEAVTNAIYHGNLELDSALREDDDSQYHRLAAERRQRFPYCDRKVCIDATLNADLVRFVIHDDGPGFNLSDVLDPTAEENIGRASGRGLMLIRSFMDEVHHSFHGSQISMLKYTSPGRALLASIEKETRTSEKQTQASLTSNVVSNCEHVLHSA